MFPTVAVDFENQVCTYFITIATNIIPEFNTEYVWAILLHGERWVANVGVLQTMIFLWWWIAKHLNFVYTNRQKIFCEMYDNWLGLDFKNIQHV